MTVLGWTIAAAAIVLILVRPWRIGEAWWASGGALLLVLTGQFAPSGAWSALARGVDVYLFLVGMMLLAALAGDAGIFRWIAARALRAAGDSRLKLLGLIYGAGIVTTALLSNDATIVVLTPAVLAALEHTDAPVLPYVVACALVANAASFVLPIANPSNLLVFAGGMPALGAWLAAFALPSFAALALTFVVLAFVLRGSLRGPLGAAEPAATAIAAPTAVALAVAAVIVVITSARSGPLGLATFACALGVTLVALARDRSLAGMLVRRIAWPIVVLTGALFVIVGAVDANGGFAATRALLAHAAALHAPFATVGVGALAAVASNVVNNLPVGLNLGETLPTMHLAPALVNAALIGVNLGPNATVNGSLATLLWLAIVRAGGVRVTPLQFALVGSAATVPALIAALLLVH